MKHFFTLLLLLFLTASTAFSHTANNLEYAIVFGACFEKSVISLKINNKTVFDKCRLGFEKEGNLSIKQSENDLEVFYNGEEKHRSPIDIDHTLKIAVTVNGKSSHFTIDLRKGNILVIDFCGDKQSTAKRKLTIDQRQEALILM